MRFIAYATVSELLALGTDGKYWRNQSVKSSAAEHLGFLCFRDQHYLWIDFFLFIFCTIWALCGWVIGWHLTGGVLALKGSRFERWHKKYFSPIPLGSSFPLDWLPSSLKMPFFKSFLIHKQKDLSWDNPRFPNINWFNLYLRAFNLFHAKPDRRRSSLSATVNQCEEENEFQDAQRKRWFLAKYSSAFPPWRRGA